MNVIIYTFSEQRLRDRCRTILGNGKSESCKMQKCRVVLLNIIQGGWVPKVLLLLGLF